MDRRVHQYRYHRQQEFVGLRLHGPRLIFFLAPAQNLKTEKSEARRNELFLTAGFLIIIWWLFWKANSATSLLSLLIGMLMMILLGRPWVDRRLVGTYAVITAIASVLAELAFG